MKPLSNAELSAFCGQLALILRSGISALEGLAIMAEDTPAGEGRELLQRLHDAMERTGSLWEALEEAECFPAYMRSMVQLGEQSGKLDDVTRSLSDYYRREDYMAKSVKSAVTYPLIMLGMMVAVLLVLLIKVLPVFSRVYEQLGATLTGVSGALLSLSGALSRYGAVIIAVIAVLAAVLFFLFGTDKGRKITGGASFFVSKKLKEKIGCARFASGMYLCLSSGLDIDGSLEMVSRLVEHPVIRQKVAAIQEMLSGGRSFSEAVTETGMFTGIYARMVSLGGKTGAMDDIMRQISEQYDEEVQDRMAGAVSRLEPTLVAILSVSVGLILLSVMLPLMGIMANIG